MAYNVLVPVHTHLLNATTHDLEFVALLDPLKIFQHLFIQIPDTILSTFSPYTSYGEATKVQYPLQPFPELVMEPSHMCLLLTLILSPPIIWLAKC